MANKVLSIEIGSGITRVAELDYKVKNPKIYHVFTFATPPNVLTDGSVNVSDIFVAALKNSLAEHNITTKRVIFILNSTRVANRTIQIPDIKESRIGEFLNTNASDYFPVDLNQYELSYESLGKIEEGSEKKLQISVLAVPKDLIESYRKLSEICGLLMVGIDNIGNSIKKLMVREIPEDIKVTIKVDEDSSIITIVEDGVIQLQRTVGYGISDAINQVRESNLFGTNIDASEALKVLNRKTCIFRRFDQTYGGVEEGEESDTEIDAEKLKQLRTSITEELRTLVGSISRIFDYYQSRNGEKKIEKVYLIGLGSVCSGLSKLMTNELNYKVVAVQQFGDMAVAKNEVEETIHMAEFFACVGASIDPLSISYSDKKEKGKGGKNAEEGGSTDSILSSVLILGLSIIVAAVLVGYGMITNAMVTAENVRLTNRVNELQYIEEVVAEYDAAKANYDWAMAIEKAASSHNDNLVAFIEELEQKMPSEIIVLSFSASATGVNMNIQVTTKAAVADVISQLRTFDSIMVGSVSAISDTKDEVGISTVSFSVECLYVEKIENVQ